MTQRHAIRTNSRASDGAFHRPWLGPWLIVAAGCFAYFNSLDGPFLFDDLAHIVDNTRIQTPKSIGHLVAGRRPVLDITLAANYAFGRLEDVRGYHAVNLAIHVLAALALYGVIRRSILIRPESSRLVRAAPRLALTTALIWVVHPLLTQSVTYLIQRAESLMGLFYLLTIYCLVRSAESPKKLRWHVAMVIACALGMGTKGVMVTAPAAALLYDRAFLSNSFKSVLRLRWRTHLALVATWTVLWWCGTAQGVLSPAAKSATVGFGFKGITPLTYALTQPEVVLRYLSLSFWPHNLCLDYAWPTVASVGGAVAPIGVLFIAAGSVVGLAYANPRLAFVAAWFFLVLIPTSSIIPIKDVLFEHRMYLSSASVILLLTLGGHSLWTTLGQRVAPRKSTPSWPVIVVVASTVLVLGYMTSRRNETYQSAVSMWQDVTKKRPQNARGFEQLGTVLVMQGLKREAAEQYSRALHIDPDYVSARANLANALFETGRLEQAEAQYREVLRLEPYNADARVNLGHTLRLTGRTDEGIEAFRAATHVELRLTTPRTLAGAHYNLGSELAKKGKLREALASMQEAAEILPDYEKAQYALARILLALGDVEAAIEHLNKTLEINPTNAEARQTMAEAQAARDSRGNEQP